MNYKQSGAPGVFILLLLWLCVSFSPYARGASPAASEGASPGDAAQAQAPVAVPEGASAAAPATPLPPLAERAEKVEETEKTATLAQEGASPGDAAQAQAPGAVPEGASVAAPAPGEAPEAPLPPFLPLPPASLARAMDFSVSSMFLGAAPLVQVVMVILLLASLASWTIILEKFLLLRRCGRVLRIFTERTDNAAGELRAEDFPDFTRKVVEAGLAAAASREEGESRAEFQTRAEKAMKAVLARRMEDMGKRASFLATVGSTSPFVGLFGTVWGIMNSFAEIAVSGDTGLEVVAPGLTEALLATAMGLAAAIPAVVAYNSILGAQKRIIRQGLAGIVRLGDVLAAGRTRVSFPAAREHPAGRG